MVSFHQSDGSGEAWPILMSPTWIVVSNLPPRFLRVCWASCATIAQLPNKNVQSDFTPKDTKSHQFYHPCFTSGSSNSAATVDLLTPQMSGLGDRFTSNSSKSEKQNNLSAYCCCSTSKSSKSGNRTENESKFLLLTPFFPSPPGKK